jgi:hypothetical protein
MNKALRNFSFCGVLAMLAAAVANASRGALDEHPSQRQLAAQVQMLSAELLRERVIDLPEDAGVWHTIVVYPDRERTDAASRRLAAALASDERLQSLTAQTKTHVYALGDPLWRERLQQHYGAAAPALIVQRPDGRVCYKASGANLPSDPRVLAGDVAAAIADCRPKPSPNPSPAPAPSPAPTIPDLAPRHPANQDDDQQVLWMIVVPMIAGLLGLYQEWKAST